MLMTFTETTFDGIFASGEWTARPADAIDIKQSWMATNATKEVDIILNTKDVFELWVGSIFVNTFPTFEETVRNAEAMVAFTIAYDSDRPTRMVR